MKTLKKRLVKYLCKKKDICCEADYDREVIIQQIIDLYKKQMENLGEPEEYLNWISNDISIMIGYENSLKKDKDMEGLKLYKEFDKINVNRKASMNKIISLLREVPLYFLLSFLGTAYYKKTLSQIKN